MDALVNQLSAEDKARIIKQIQAGEPLSDRDFCRLLPSQSEPRLYWPDKKSLRPPLSTLHNHQYFHAVPDSHEWQNQLIHGHCLSVLSILRTEEWKTKIDAAGGIKLVYIDPPFDVGTDFKLKHSIGPADRQNPFTPVAYNDRWSKHSGELLTLLYNCFSQVYEILAEDGSLYVHCDWRLSGVIRLMLDDVFGKDRHRNEICWSYNSRTMASQWFARKHDSIFVYSKGPNPIFNADAVRIPLKKESQSQYNQIDAEGRSYKKQSKGKRSYLNPLGQPCSDVWDIQLLGSRTAERLGYPTQKPLALLERIIKAASNEGDIVADFFCGSGVLAEAAHHLKRRWISSDLGSLAIQTTTKRLLRHSSEAQFVCSTCFETDHTAQMVEAHYGVSPQKTCIAVVDHPSLCLNRLQSILHASEHPSIVVLAYGYDSACLQWLNENRTVHNVSCKIIPKHQIQSPPKGDVFFMSALWPVAQMNQKENGISIELQDLICLDSTPQENAPFVVLDGQLYQNNSKKPHREQLTILWSDWIEGWSIDVPTSSGHQVLWQYFRPQNKADLCLQSPELALSQCPHFTLTIYDIFGHTHRRNIVLPYTH